MRVLDFATADEVEAKVEQIRAKFGFDKIEQDIRDGVRGFDWTDLAADQFEQIYDITPNKLMDILGN